jgi:Fur family ferric uptake transcriptional regulator
MLQKRIDDQPTISQESLREAEGIFLRHLKRVGLKQTEQRNAILRTFLETREHLSIDELHRLVKKTDSRIGVTTVYRTLKLLAGCGLASEVAFHDGIARYEHQYNRRNHHHMVCTECGASVEFFLGEGGRDRTGNWAPASVCDHSPYLPDLWRLRRVPAEDEWTANCLAQKTA